MDKLSSFLIGVGAAYLTYRTIKPIEHRVWDKLRSLRSKGSVTVEILVGIFTLAAATVLFIILQQVFLSNLQPAAIERGTSATELNYITIVWTILPIVIVLTVVLSMVISGLQDRGSGGYGF